MGPRRRDTVMNDQGGVAASRGRRRFLEAGAAAVGASLLAPLIGSARAQTTAPAPQATAEQPQHPVRLHRPGTLRRPLADGPVAAGPRAAAAEGRDLHQPSMPGDHVHVVALGDPDRPADRRQRHVREPRHAVDEEPVARTSDHRPHAAQGRLLHRLQGQVASEPRVRHQVGRAVHDAEHGEVRLRRQFLAGRPDRPHAGRLQLRPHHRRQRDQLAAHQGPAAGRRRQAVVHVRELRQSARHHVLQHRRARRERPGHRQAPPACRPRARARALQGELGRAGPGQPAPAVRCAGPAQGARRVRPRLGLYPGQRAARGRALEALQRLLRQLHPQRRPLARGAAGRAAGAATRREHHHRLHLRPRRDGRRPRPARQGARSPTARPRTCRCTSSIPTLPAASSARRCRATSTSCRRCCRWPA